MQGTCRLCAQTSILQKSHLIPKWAYKRVMAYDTTGGKNPVKIADGTAVLSSNQTTKHLLCSSCEQRFSTHEDVVAGLTAEADDQITLFQKVTPCGTPQGVLATFNSNSDADSLAYFVSSVLWRASVMTGDCKLGPYEIAFREYLLGNSGFPSEAIITVGLLRSSQDIDVRGWLSEPTSRKTPTFWVHGFLLAGLAIRCMVGKTLPTQWHQVSLTSNSATRYLSLLHPPQCADFLAAAEMVGDAQVKGKLSKSAASLATEK